MPLGFVEGALDPAAAPACGGTLPHKCHGAKLYTVSGNRSQASSIYEKTLCQTRLPRSHLVVHFVDGAEASLTLTLPRA